MRQARPSQAKRAVVGFHSKGLRRLRFGRLIHGAALIVYIVNVVLFHHRYKTSVFHHRHKTSVFHHRYTCLFFRRHDFRQNFTPDLLVVIVGSVIWRGKGGCCHLAS